MDQPSFAMLAGTHGLVGHGISGHLPPGPAATLGDRVRAFFHGHPSAPLLAGALPFDRDADDLLLAPARIGNTVPASPAPASPTPASPTPDAARWILHEDPPSAAFARSVSRALEHLAPLPDNAAAALRKVVLARSLVAMADRPADPAALLRRLHAADPAVTAFLAPLPPGPDGAPRFLVGATPELLVSRTGRRVVSHPLAGSARRHAGPADDAAARAALLASAKDRHEHALVVEFILDTLAPHCRDLVAPDGPAIRATGRMWHLGTRIEGALRDPDLSAAGLAALLHPTPAVCGMPREAAAALIPALEGMKRGFYAGTVGWCDRAGDGAWHVSIRCAEVSGCRVRLFAGAGIVPGSTPAAEVAETAAKFRTMLDAIGEGGAAAG